MRLRQAWVRYCTYPVVLCCRYCLGRPGLRRQFMTPEPKTRRKHRIPERAQEETAGWRPGSSPRVAQTDCIRLHRPIWSWLAQFGLSLVEWDEKKEGEGNLGAKSGKVTLIHSCWTDATHCQARPGKCGAGTPPLKIGFQSAPLLACSWRRGTPAAADPRHRRWAL